MPDDALRIHQKHRARIDATLGIEHTVGLADGAMRPVIRQQRKRNAPELFGPRRQAGNCVGADLQDFDVLLLEFFVVRTEPADLILSAAGESQRQEGHDRAAAAVVGQRKGVAKV